MPVSQGKLLDCASRVVRDLVTPGPSALPAVVGLKEIGRMFGVADQTPYAWRSKGVLPEQDGNLSNNPYWKLPSIYAFAEATGKPIIWDPWGVVAPAGDVTEVADQ